MTVEDKKLSCMLLSYKIAKNRVDVSKIQLFFVSMFNFRTLLIRNMNLTFSIKSFKRHHLLHKL